MGSCNNFFFTIGLTAIFISFSSGKTFEMSKADYLQERKALIDADWQSRTGGSISLNNEERKLNDTLMKWKQEETANSSIFPPAMHFFQAKKYIDASQVFRLIRKMPKGAALHVHDSSMVDVHWLIKNATYDIRCYMCFDENDVLLFQFFEKPPKNPKKDCSWTSVAKLRSTSHDPETFDNLLYKNLTMIVDDPDEAYPDAASAWRRFRSLFLSADGLIYFAPVTRLYVYEALQEFYDDNVQYLEIRSLLTESYESNGTTHDKEWLLQTYREVSKQFVKDHSDFVGSKIIATSSRTSSNVSAILAAIKDVINLRRKFPDTLVGYDIVGFEDEGRSLFDYVDALLYPSQNSIDLKYFFHAGETDWEGTSVDMNLFDAILLNTSRIGHGYAALKHPVVLQKIKERNIGVEICPISNQVLRLVKDLRNHPGAALMSDNFPVVISSDDPGLWGASGLSYDFYEALMGLGGAWADLATLKQLAMNSIMQSSLSAAEKKATFQLWSEKWDKFVRQSVEELQL